MEYGVRVNIECIKQKEHTYDSSSQNWIHHSPWYSWGPNSCTTCKVHCKFWRMFINLKLLVKTITSWTGRATKPHPPTKSPPAPTVNVVVSGASVRGDAMGDGIGIPGQRRGSPSWAPLKPPLLDGCISHPSERYASKLNQFQTSIGGTWLENVYLAFGIENVLKNSSRPMFTEVGFHQDQGCKSEPAKHLGKQNNPGTFSKISWNRLQDFS